MSFNGITNQNQYQQKTGYYNNPVDKKEKPQTNRSGEAEKTQTTGHVDKSKEQALSSQAQDVLKQLKEKYGNMDFMVADFKNAGEAKAILSKGTKDFSVLFSGDELEKMASDENYMKEKMNQLDGAARMSDEINQKLGFESAFDKSGASITKMGIAFNDDGTTSFFVEMEKASEKQKKHIEEAIEDKYAEKKSEKNKTEKEHHGYAKGSTDTKRTVVQADSIEELLEKMGAVDWDKVKGEIHLAQAAQVGEVIDVKA